MLKVKSFSFNAFEERTILLWDDTKEGVVVDPGCCSDSEFDALASEIEKEGIVLKAVWLTHGHRYMGHTHIEELVWWAKQLDVDIVI